MMRRTQHAVALALALSALPAAARADWSSYRELTQIAVDDQHLYALKRNGNLLVDNNGDGFRVYDSGTGTTQMAVDGGVVYILKPGLGVWRRTGEDAGWDKIDTAGDTKQLLAKAGGVYVLKNDGNVWQWAGGDWQKIDEGTGSRQIAADKRGNLYVLKKNGNIWIYSGDGNWSKIDDGTGTKQIAAAGGNVYALKDSGNIWRYDGNWSQIDQGTNTRSLFATRDAVFIVKGNGEIWTWRDGGSWRKVGRENVRYLTVHKGTIYVLRDDGQIVTYAAE